MKAVIYDDTNRELFILYGDSLFVLAGNLESIAEQRETRHTRRKGGFRMKEMWVSLDERKPTENKKYLVCLSEPYSPKMSIAVKFWFCSHFDYNGGGNEILFWMDIELPEASKELRQRRCMEYMMAKGCDSSGSESGRCGARADALSQHPATIIEEDQR